MISKHLGGAHSAWESGQAPGVSVPANTQATCVCWGMGREQNTLLPRGAPRGTVGRASVCFSHANAFHPHDYPVK